MTGKNRKLYKKMISFGIVLALSGNLLPLQSMAAENVEKVQNEQEETVQRKIITIDSAEDFLEFADQCALDQWSSDKMVVLNTDLDLAGTGFEAIPVFTGIFDGQGHTISNFRYTGAGYVAGLFRYIKKGGVVQDLKVQGNVIAEDEKECIGGLCGVNYGTIERCSFQGNVSGRTTVGGLTGVNEGTGIIRNCAVSGHVTGYYSTGGIVGKNHGTLTYCVSRAAINNDSEWVEEDDEMGLGIFLSLNISDSKAELFSGVDTGGIAGHSDGTIIRCSNYGRVGYEHTGYNIGGIAGRQCGVVSACTNNGTVYGRKDVGGIVGQMEPYIEVDEAQSLRNAVNKLHDLIEKTIEDMGEGKDAVKEELDHLTVYSDGALEAGDALAGQMADFVDDNLDQAQAMTDRLSHVMEMLPGVFDDVYAAEESFSEVNAALALIADDVKAAADISGDYIETDYNRLSLLSTVGGSILSMQYYPEAGEQVHLVAEPNDGYGIDIVRVYDAYGNGISVDREDEKNYTFTMPDPNVRVEAYFTWQGTSSGFQIREPGVDSSLKKPDQK